jgi:hypothetical protein
MWLNGAKHSFGMRLLHKIEFTHAKYILISIILTIELAGWWRLSIANKARFNLVSFVHAQLLPWIPICTIHCKKDLFTCMHCLMLPVSLI